MNIQHLTKMVNEIAAFFKGESGPEKAVSDVANHLSRYWDPRMRREIVAHYSKGGAGLCDISMKAVAELSRLAQQ